MRAKSAEERRLLERLDPIAEAAGFGIVRLRLRGGAARRTLQIMAETAAGEMLVRDCAALSRIVSEALEVEGAVSGDYTLEVSSPGVDRPLTRLKDFQTYEGYEVRLELDRLAENRKRLRGVLAGVEDGQVLIDLEGESQTALVPFAWISEAKLALTDDLLRRGAAERALRLAAEDPGEDPTADPASPVTTYEEEEPA